ncbi:protein MICRORCHIDIA 2-like isoform X1 [Panicum virgatum]|uniref:protein MICRORCHIDIA 2-like isoform X1 n=1 Tax=Panicum virgatum TaxID=38727 RepID=UPI0019D5F63C|nr:protein MICRORCHIDIA 2-like isoform X1 [Panicum virgatum]XP_039819384.1 protein MICRORCHIDIA 2-like isoform X1 [Panicum virgatum]XP_039819385.1 protein MICRORCHIDIA 2-like isoform X1 [Panicum virgatum]XP_039819386.1 protein MICRORCHIDIA 2-like isoform X1 [Panicum virgatum]XP_039819387.1 protein MICRORCHIDIA 2-like isoform X1 [Panicum virgatum]XP_039819389.1 protein MICRORCHIDIA 2-like isoform X1 [Panicum virgatum]XP_039819390.1 protein MICRORCHIDIA 2-like isoform X1 [Panicum virgatum]
MPVAMTGGSSGGGGGRVLDCRSFWKAGAYEAPAAPSHEFQDALETGDFDRARVHPKFLHTNATSHKWAFGAIAELLDNAVDEINNGATFIKVDKSINSKDNSPMLVFQDNGGGMDPEGVRRCMSLGFSTKKSKNTIGQYGNGFKTSTMRLGADAIVFTHAIRGSLFSCSNVTLSIGLLSYTFLRRTMKDDIVVPMLDFKLQDGDIVPLVYGSQGDWDSSLKIILDWSPFSSKEELLQQFQDVGSHGTKVLVYNLWMNDDGLLELDFEDDDEDILLRDQGSASGGASKGQKEIVQQHISHRLRFSLRAYTSILYLKKFDNFRIILRGKPVEQIRITDELKFKKVVTYKPHAAHDSQVVSVKVDVGFAKEAPILGIFGMNVYNKNRLIMPFWKVLQEGSSRGRSVVGVLEANFIEPAHDKQDFERTPLFNRLETKLRQIIVDFWKEKCHLIGYQPMDPHLRSQYKATLKDSGGPAQVHHKASSARRTRGLSSNLLPETYDDIAAVGLANNGSHLQSSGQAEENNMESEGLDEDLVEFGSGVLDPNFIENLSEENIALFSRREELRQRDTQLKRKIGDLEHELEETKRKCGQLAAELKVRKNQLNLPSM